MYDGSAASSGYCFSNTSLTSTLDLMISLCPGCHAKVERTKMVLSEMTPLPLVLWREQHPEGQEQIMLGFDVREPAAEAIRLSKEERKGD